MVWLILMDREFFNIVTLILFHTFNLFSWWLLDMNTRITKDFIFFRKVRFTYLSLTHYCLFCACILRKWAHTHAKDTDKYFIESLEYSRKFQNFHATLLEFSWLGYVVKWFLWKINANKLSEAWCKCKQKLYRMRGDAVKLILGFIYNKVRFNWTKVVLK